MYFKRKELLLCTSDIKMWDFKYIDGINCEYLKIILVNVYADKGDTKISLFLGKYIEFIYTYLNRVETTF